LKVVDPYLVMTIILVLLSVLIGFSKLPEVKEKGEPDEVPGRDKKTSIVQYPYLILGVAALFMAGACEVIPIDCIILYSKALGIPLSEARHFAEYTLYAMLVGYITSTVVIPRFFSQQAALRNVSILGFLLSLGAYFSTGMTSIYFMIAMGFGAAMLWGTIWGLAVRELGTFTKMGAALLLMSVVGGGLFPLLFGRLIDVYPDTPQMAVTVLLPCYLFLIYYATKGYKIKNWA
jgi:FHS family L-fucose permease-like MFS transporter